MRLGVFHPHGWAGEKEVQSLEFLGFQFLTYFGPFLDAFFQGFKVFNGFQWFFLGFAFLVIFGKALGITKVPFGGIFGLFFLGFWKADASFGVFSF